MNWSLFLLNEIMKDTILVQEAGKSFTYYWLLILIELVGWMESMHYQRMEVDIVNVCQGEIYNNQWVLKEK